MTLDKETDKRFDKAFKKGLYGRVHLTEAPKTDPMALPTLRGGTQLVLTNKVKDFITDEKELSRQEERDRIFKKLKSTELHSEVIVETLGHGHHYSIMPVLAGLVNKLEEKLKPKE